MSFSTHLYHSTKYNHSMIRSNFRNKRGSKFTLPPAAKASTHKKKIPTASRGRTEAKKLSTYTKLNQDSIEYFLRIAVGVLILSLTTFVIYTYNTEKANMAKAQSTQAVTVLCDNCIVKCSPDDLVCIEGNLIRKGFHLIAVAQYAAALSHFESVLLANKYSKDAHLGMTYALVGLCKRDNLHCELSDQYMEYVLNSNKYTNRQLFWIIAFLNDKYVDAYLNTNACKECRPLSGGVS